MSNSEYTNSHRTQSELLSLLRERGAVANQLLNTRYAWLVENGKPQGDGLKYLTFDPQSLQFIWVNDVNEAIQFSRRKDAELIANDCEDAWKIVEHGFAHEIL